MQAQRLVATAQALMAGDRGLLAMDESTGTCNKRFAEIGIPQTEEARCAYRDMIVTTPHLGDAISGAILYDETIRQKTLRGLPFARALEDAGIIPGIKVVAKNGWFAARPSGTEAIYKIYAESFAGTDHLQRILKEAQTIVDRAIASPQKDH